MLYSHLLLDNHLGSGAISRPPLLQTRTHAQKSSARRPLALHTRPLIVSMRITTRRRASPLLRTGKRGFPRNSMDQKKKSTERVCVIYDLTHMCPYRHYKNRDKEEAFLAQRDDVSSGTQWERINRHLDSSPAAVTAALKAGRRDTSRMRELLRDLEKDPNAPGK